MSKEKACRQCKTVISEGNKCTNCNGTQFTTFWRGFVRILNPEESEIAKKMSAEKPGKYALQISR
jgi:DNA-directed RNA polymerase subunit E"